VNHVFAELIAPVFVGAEQDRRLRVGYRLARAVSGQVLLRDIGYVMAVFGIIAVFSEEMVKRLVFPRSNMLGNGVIPLVRVLKLRIDIEDYTAKAEIPVLDYLADRELCFEHLILLQPETPHYPLR